MQFRVNLRTLIIPALAVYSLTLSFNGFAKGVSGHAEVGSFIAEMVEKHGFEQAYLEGLFRDVEIKDSILKAISRPAEAKPWYEYRPIFLKESRIKGGVKFWKRNAATLKRAEEQYGVPAEIIVAIIGVETRFGSNTGSYRVLDSLSTLAFAYPPRAKFFRSELEHFLLMSREEGMNPLKLKGSYAGAMGAPQFISSSYRHYAIDFDGDGQRDLINNMEDAIGSVANYFKRHGWKNGDEIAFRATVRGKRYSEIVEQGYKPNTALGQFHAHGISVPAKLGDDTQAALLELQTGHSHEYWVALKNFYVITRYNHSPLYAMAVYQLAEEIKKRM